MPEPGTPRYKYSSMLSESDMIKKNLCVHETPPQKNMSSVILEQPHNLFLPELLYCSTVVAGLVTIVVVVVELLWREMKIRRTG